MLTEIQIKNFRCFKRLAVSLKPLTVLLGENDTGKSVFLQALLKLANLQHTHVVHDSWKFEPGQILLSVATDDGSSIGVQTDAGGRGHIVGNIHETIPVGFYDLPSTGPNMISDGVSDLQVPPSLGTDGSNVPTLVDYFLRRDRDRFFDFVDEACELLSGVQNIEIRTPQPHQREIALRLDNGLLIPGNQTSVGVRILLFFWPPNPEIGCLN